MNNQSVMRADLHADDSMMTLTEVAEHLNVHPVTIYRLLKTDTQLGQFKVGRLWRFRREDVARLSE